MKAIQLNSPGVWEKLEIDMPKDTLGKGQALVKVKKIGICGTDLHAFRGSQPFFEYPRILGHELAVEVVAVADDVQNLHCGDRCSVEPYYNDGVSQATRNGKPNCGDTLRVLGVHVDGGMQEFFKYPAKYLHPSKTLSDDQLAIIEPLAIGRHAVDRAQISSEDIVLVIGAGPIGLGTVQFVKLTGATVILMDIDTAKLEKGKAVTGISHLVNANGNVIDQLTKILDGDLPTIILDATGNPDSMMNTFDYVAAGGTIVFIGLFMGDVVFNDPNFHKKELTLKASRAAISSDFKSIIELMEKGEIVGDPFITHRIKFDEVPTQFEKLYSYGGSLIKAIIDF